MNRLSISLAIGFLLTGCAIVVGPPRGRVVVGPPPPIVVETEPRVVLIPETDVYYAPDVAANLYVVGGFWFYLHDGHWFRGRSYRGPWVFVEERHLPSGLRRIPPGFRRHAPDREERREHGRGDLQS